MESKISEILKNGEALIDLEGYWSSNENYDGLLEEIAEEKVNQNQNQNISPKSLYTLSSPNKGGFSSRNTISDLGCGDISKTKLLEEFSDIFR